MPAVHADAARGAALAQNASFLLTRASVVAAQRDNKALAPLGLKVRSYSVLCLALDEEPPTQREIAEYLRLDPSQVVALVDDLEDRGLVARETDPRDRRAKVVAATDEGRSICAEARAVVTDVSTHVDAGDAVILQRILAQLAFEE
ncbi:MarR family winged helix-turn-helix transcriptional regulator [Microbacterium karelineae]|uniref:MarR family winged helix-turn-helix transcriptional regulator n=1 Tax=Microbacterium karelineae TaxID=2654283 RepID=UPI0012EA4E0C|nr:MarR family transcriptional regulator [Microbacterium karelineae]